MRTKWDSTCLEERKMKTRSKKNLPDIALTAARYVFALIMVALVGAFLVKSQGNDPL